MALSGLHVVCGYAGAPTMRHNSQAIMGDAKWSEAPPSGVPTTNVAPPPSDAMGDPIFRIRAAADSWVAIGSNPDAGGSPRFYVPAETDYDVFAEPGDKVVWVTA